MKKTILIFNLIFCVGFLFSQEYNPYTPYTYLKQDSTKPIVLDVWSMNNDHTEWGTRLKLRDNIVYNSKNYDSSGTFYLFGWRGTYNFCYTKAEYMSNSKIPDTVYSDGEIELSQYDVRDFLAADNFIKKEKDENYFLVTVKTWVPAGIIDYRGDGKPGDFNNHYRTYIAAKERDDETGKLNLIAPGDNYNWDGYVSFKFKNENEADELINKIKTFGKKVDPYLGDANPMTYTIDRNTNKKITLKKEDLILYRKEEYMTHYNYMFTLDGLLWLAEIDSSKDSQTGRWKSHATFSSIPIANIDFGDYQFDITSRGSYIISLSSNTKMVADRYTFGENRRGICSQSIASKNKVLGYKGQESIVFFMNSKEEMNALLAKIGKSSIPMEEVIPTSYSSSYSSSNSYKESSTEDNATPKQSTTTTSSTPSKESQEIVITIKNTGDDVLELYYQETVGTRDNTSFRVQKGQSAKLKITIGCSVFYNSKGGRGDFIFTASKEMNGTTKTIN